MLWKGDLSSVWLCVGAELPRLVAQEKSPCLGDEVRVGLTGDFFVFYFTLTSRPLHSQLCLRPQAIAHICYLFLILILENVILLCFLLCMSLVIVEMISSCCDTCSVWKNSAQLQERCPRALAFKCTDQIQVPNLTLGT